MLLAWLSILEPCGSYFKEGNGLKYRRRKRTANGYVLRAGNGNASDLGQTSALMFGKALPTRSPRWLPTLAHGSLDAGDLQQIHDGSALQMSDLLGAATFGAIVFSPPYATGSTRTPIHEGRTLVWRIRQLLRRRPRPAETVSPLPPRSRSFCSCEDSLHSERLIELMDPTVSSVRMGVPSALRGYFDAYGFCSCSLPLASLATWRAYCRW